MPINMTTHNFKYFLVFKIKQFITSKRPGLKDFCLFSEMEESWASEVTNHLLSHLFLVEYEKKMARPFFASKIIANYMV